MQNQREKVLYIQYAPDRRVSLEAAVFLEAADQDAWLQGERRYTWQFASKDLHELNNLPPDSIIPVGSVEFIQKVLAELGYPSLSAVNIPPELSDQKYLHRKVQILKDKEALLKLLCATGQEYLVKPARAPKLFDTTSSKYLEELPDGEPLLVSELLPPIAAEWRAFVLRGRILTIRPYLLQSWVCPNRSLVEEMARKVNLPSCTIDVAVLQRGSTVLLEVHPFIACGLYGFEGPDILRMANIAWTHQIQPM